MKSIFTRHQLFQSDIYFADYTEYIRQGGKNSYAKGVVIADHSFPQIESLSFENPNHVQALAVNFEGYPAFFKPDGVRKVRNCEGMLVSEEGNAKRWLALVELKYCKGNDANIIANFSDALDEITKTFLYLRDEKKLFENSSFRFYWVISIPEHSEKIPFSAFVLNQDDLTDIKNQYNATLISDNSVTIWTGSVIVAPVYH